MYVYRYTSSFHGKDKLKLELTPRSHNIHQGRSRDNKRNTAGSQRLAHSTLKNIPHNSKYFSISFLSYINNLNLKEKRIHFFCISKSFKPLLKSLRSFRTQNPCFTKQHQRGTRPNRTRIRVCYNNTKRVNAIQKTQITPLFSLTFNDIRFCEFLYISNILWTQFSH